MKNLPNTDSKWTSGSIIFKIEKLEYDGTDIWVYYKNEATKQEYNCLVGAFLNRFNEQLT